MLCGKLFCHNGQENPNYGRMVRFSDCKASFFEDYTKDYGQVDTGTKCGDGKVTGCVRLCKELHLFECCRTKSTVCISVSNVFVCVVSSRCAARTSVWILLQLTEIQTVQRNARAML